MVYRSHNDLQALGMGVGRICKEKGLNRFVEVDYLSLARANAAKKTEVSEKRSRTPRNSSRNKNESSKERRPHSKRMSV